MDSDCGGRAGAHGWVWQPAPVTVGMRDLRSGRERVPWGTGEGLWDPLPVRETEVNVGVTEASFSSLQLG